MHFKMLMLINIVLQLLVNQIERIIYGQQELQLILQQLNVLDIILILKVGLFGTKNILVVYLMMTILFI